MTAQEKEALADEEMIKMLANDEDIDLSSSSISDDLLDAMSEFEVETGDTLSLDEISTEEDVLQSIAGEGTAEDESNDAVAAASSELEDLDDIVDMELLDEPADSAAEVDLADEADLDEIGLEQDPVNEIAEADDLEEIDELLAETADNQIEDEDLDGTEETTINSELDADLNDLDMALEEDLTEASEATNEEVADEISDEIAEELSAAIDTETTAEQDLNAVDTVESLEEAIDIDQGTKEIVAELQQATLEVNSMAIATAKQAQTSAEQTQQAIEATFAAAEKAFNTVKNAGYVLDPASFNANLTQSELAAELDGIKQKNQQLKEANEIIKKRLMALKP